MGGAVPDGVDRVPEGEDDAVPEGLPEGVDGFPVPLPEAEGLPVPVGLEEDG